MQNLTANGKAEQNSAQGRRRHPAGPSTRFDAARSKDQRHLEEIGREVQAIKMIARKHAKRHR